MCFNVTNVEKSMTDAAYLFEAFVWTCTDQGYDFWSDQYRLGVITDEGRAALLDLLAAHKKWESAA